MSRISNKQQVDYNNYNQTNKPNANKRENSLRSDNTSIFSFYANNNNNSQNTKTNDSLKEGKKLLGKGAGIKNSVLDCNNQMKEADHSSAAIYDKMNGEVTSQKAAADTSINNSKTIIEENLESLETANTAFNETAAAITENQEAITANTESQEKTIQEIENYTQQLEAAQSNNTGVNSVDSLTTAAEADQARKDGKPNGGADTQKQNTEAIKTQLNASMKDLKTQQEEQAEYTGKNEELSATKNESKETINSCVAENDTSFIQATNNSAQSQEDMRQKQKEEETQAANDQYFADGMGVVSTTGSTVQTTGGVCTKVSETLTAAAAGTGACTFGASAAALESVAVPLGTLGVYAEGAGAGIATTASGIQFAKTGDAKDGLAFAASAASFIGSVATASKDLNAIKDANGGSLWKADTDVLDANIAATQDELVKSAETAMQKSTKATEKAEKLLTKQGVVLGVNKTQGTVNIDKIRMAATTKVDNKFAKKGLDAATRNREIEREVNNMLRKIK